MRLFALAITVTLLAAPTAVIGAPTDSSGSADAVQWDDFDDPVFAPGQVPETNAAVPIASVGVRAQSIPLGPFGVAPDGVRGRVHTVSSGETLWDISDAYLGTPWVWPGVWNENVDIENPHLINPGDQIWITADAMRRITKAEADELVSAAVAVPVVAAFDEAEEEVPLEEPLAEEPMLEELPSLEPMVTSTDPGDMLSIPPHQVATIVSESAINAAAKIVDSPTVRVMLTQGDETYLSVGEGEVAVGDEFTIFRDVRDIRDPNTRALLGHHVESIGWLKVQSVEGFASAAMIEEATDEIRRGDRIITRQLPVPQVTVRTSDPQMIGQIALTPGNREMAGSTDSVYLNLGSIHGVELGTKLAVYSGTTADLELPGAVIAEMVVIKVEPEVSAAFVTETQRELQVGDEVRGVGLRPTQAAKMYLAP